MQLHNSFMLLLLAPLVIVPLWRIVQKAGFHGAWSLFILVPGANLLGLWLLAFVDWPKSRRD
jgi:hypothetical protein